MNDFHKNPEAETARSSNHPGTMNRRHFLASLGLSAAAFSLITSGTFSPSWVQANSVSHEDIPVNPNHFVLLADTHCGPHLKHQINFMKKSLSEIAAMNPRPAHVLIYGDFSFLYGKKTDYLVLKELMATLDKVQIPWTVCMGNHDRRDFFSEIFPEHAGKSLMADRLVFKVETPNMDFILLDSLCQAPDDSRWITPGEVLDDQKDWLNETLKKQTKPVIVGAHHSLDETKVDDILKSHSCVAGYVIGHHHTWSTEPQKDLPALILPSNGHWGDIGLVNVHANENEAVFKFTMRDFLVFNKTPEFKPNPLRHQKLAEKQGAVWRLDLK